MLRLLFLEMAVSDDDAKVNVKKAQYQRDMEAQEGHKNTRSVVAATHMLHDSECCFKAGSKFRLLLGWELLDRHCDIWWIHLYFQKEGKHCPTYWSANRPEYFETSRVDPRANPAQLLR